MGSETCLYNPIFLNLFNCRQVALQFIEHLLTCVSNLHSSRLAQTRCKQHKFLDGSFKRVKSDIKISLRSADVTKGVSNIASHA